MWHYCNAREAIQPEMAWGFRVEIRHFESLQTVADVYLRFIEFRDMGEAFLE